MLVSILVGFVYPLRLKLGALFSLMTVSLASIPFCLLLFESRLVRLCFLSLMLQAIHLLPQQWPFMLLKMMVVSLPDLMAVVLLVGVAATSFCHVLIAASRTILLTNVRSNSTSLLLLK